MDILTLQLGATEEAVTDRTAELKEVLASHKAVQLAKDQAKAELAIVEQQLLTDRAIRESQLQHHTSLVSIPPCPCQSHYDRHSGGLPEGHCQCMYQLAACAWPTLRMQTKNVSTSAITVALQRRINKQLHEDVTCFPAQPFTEACMNGKDPRACIATRSMQRKQAVITVSESISATSKDEGLNHAQSQPAAMLALLCLLRRKCLCVAGERAPRGVSSSASLRTAKTAAVEV